MAAAARACTRALDEAGVDTAVVCGLSMGGYVAFELWRAARPRVAALVLANTRAEPDTPEAAAARRALAERLRSEGTGFLVDRAPAAARGRTPRPSSRERVRGWIGDQTADAIAAAALGMAERPDSVPDLAEIDVPTLVITGDARSADPARRHRRHRRRRARRGAPPDRGRRPPVEPRGAGGVQRGARRRAGRARPRALRRRAEPARTGPPVDWRHRDHARRLRAAFPLRARRLPARCDRRPGRGQSVLVAAPTGSGKTVVAEYAIERALDRGRKAFYTTPLKALSNQKFGDFVASTAPSSVGLLTGDNSINAEASVVVMTTEVLRNMLYERSTTLTGLHARRHGRGALPPGPLPRRRLGGGPDPPPAVGERRRASRRRSRTPRSSASGSRRSAATRAW